MIVHQPSRQPSLFSQKISPDSGGLALASIQAIVAPASAQAPAPAPMKPEDRMKYPIRPAEHCTGCRSCEYGCSQYHQKGRSAFSRPVSTSRGSTEWSMFR